VELEHNPPCVMMWASMTPNHLIGSFLIDLLILHFTQKWWRCA